MHPYYYSWLTGIILDWKRYVQHVGSRHIGTPNVYQVPTCCDTGILYVSTSYQL